MRQAKMKFRRGEPNSPRVRSALAVRSKSHRTGFASQSLIRAGRDRLCHAYRSQAKSKVPFLCRRQGIQAHQAVRFDGQAVQATLLPIPNPQPRNGSAKGYDVKTTRESRSRLTRRRCKSRRTFPKMANTESVETRRFGGTGRNRQGRFGAHESQGRLTQERRSRQKQIE